MSILDISAIVGAIIVAGLIAELIARYRLPRTRYYVHRPFGKAYLHPDPALFPAVENRIDIAVNRDGERGDDPPRRGKVYRILLAGGSSVENYFCGQQTNWGAVIQHRLSSPDSLRTLGVDAVHVGNIGKAGVDSGSLRFILEKTLPNYPQLDAVVVMVGASDILRWMEVGSPSDRPVQVLGAEDCFQQNPDRAFKWRPKQTALAEVARRTLPRLILRPVFVRGRGTWLTRAREMRLNAAELRDDYGPAAIVVDTFERYMRDIVELCRRKGVRVIIARQPWFEKESFTPAEEAAFWHGGVGQAFREPVRVFYSHRALFQLMRELDARAAALSDDLGVTHVDVRAGVEMSLRCFYDHFHFTPAGCEQVGGLIADAILHRERAWGASEAS